VSQLLCRSNIYNTWSAQWHHTITTAAILYPVESFVFFTFDLTIVPTLLPFAIETLLKSVLFNSIAYKKPGPAALILSMMNRSR
jgi:hypothetical protein